MPPQVRLADDVMTGRLDSPLLWLAFYVTLLLPWTWAILLVLLVRSLVNGEAALGADRSSWAASMIVRINFYVAWPSLFVGLGIWRMMELPGPLRNISYGGFPISFILLLIVAILLPALTSLPSRIVRAHLAAALGYRSRDSLEYTFHCSICDPPFRKRTTAPLLVECAIPSDSSVELAVPPCFLPSPTSMQRPPAVPPAAPPLAGGTGGVQDVEIV